MKDRVVGGEVCALALAVMYGLLGFLEGRYGMILSAEYLRRGLN